MNTLDPNALECLAVIVEEGGFERAALRLSIPLPHPPSHPPSGARSRNAEGEQGPRPGEFQDSGR